MATGARHYSPPPPDLSGKRFLVVDDYEAMRGILRDILARSGAGQVDFAASGVMALSQLERNRYDAVICDLHLGPGQNGLQVLEQARHLQYLAPHAAWIMISAEKTADMITGTMESRPDDYLIKPITESLLYTRLTRQMARKALLAPVVQAMQGREYLKALRMTEDLLEQVPPPHAWELKRLRAELALQTSDYDTARHIYQEALEQRELPWAHLGLAKMHFHEGAFQQARQELEVITSNNRVFLEAYDLLAHTLDRMGDLESAQAVLTRALATSPRSALRQGLLGEIAYKRGDLATAERAFLHNIEFARGTPQLAADPYLWLNRVSLALGKRDEALRVLFSLASDMYDNPTSLLLSQAMEIPVRFQFGERDQAKKLVIDLSMPLKREARNLPPEAVFDLAPPMIDLGDKDTAATLLAGVVSNNHEHPEYLERTRAVYARAGLAEEGRALVSEATRAASDIMDQGVRLARAGRLDQAIELTREARTRMPNNPRLLLNHAYLLIAWMDQHGRDLVLAQEAQDCIETASRLKPSEKRAGELMGKLELLGNNFVV